MQASTQHPREALPLPFARMLSRVKAAIYVGVSATTFDKMIVDKLMPTPKEIYSRKVWDVRSLDKAIDMLPGGELDEANPWDEQEGETM